MEHELEVNLRYDLRSYVQARETLLKTGYLLSKEYYDAQLRVYELQIRCITLALLKG